jgi:TRAP-type C4-dicarboxylate transport system permease small subunit
VRVTGPDRTAKALLRSFGGALAGLVLVTFTALVLYSVVMRYFFARPPMWGEEVPKLLFVWMIFIGAGFAYLSGANIRMTVLIERVPRGPRRLIEIAMHLCVLVMLGVILWYSQPILRLTSGSTSLATGLANSWTYWPLPLGAGLLILNEIRILWHLMRGGVDDLTGAPNE